METIHFEPQQAGNLPCGVFTHLGLNQFAEDFTISDSADRGIGLASQQS
jgi:hypothetical protein